jgi:hypothetical protein
MLFVKIEIITQLIVSINQNTPHAKEANGNTPGFEHGRPGPRVHP